MQRSDPALPAQHDTVAELRGLYRAAEARAARLRLLSGNGRQLTGAEADSLATVLQGCADRLGYFLGQRGGAVGAADGAGLPIHAPGANGRLLARLKVDGLAELGDIADPEDREAVVLQLEMIGATMDRVERARDLQEREARLEFVVGRLFSAQEEERRRVSHELHDGVAQTATALARMLEGPQDSQDPAKLAGIARNLVRELRAVIGGLRPTVLDDLGLEAALRALAESLEDDGYEVEIAIASDMALWPSHTETALYRVAQEALANIRKHAGGPCLVRMELTARHGDDQSILKIIDTGTGPRHGEEPGRAHFGISVMRERMASIGGALLWQVRPDGGVCVTAHFPGIARP